MASRWEHPNCHVDQGLPVDLQSSNKINVWIILQMKPMVSYTAQTTWTGVHGSRVLWCDTNVVNIAIQEMYSTCYCKIIVPCMNYTVHIVRL